MALSYDGTASLPSQAPPPPRKLKFQLFEVICGLSSLTALGLILCEINLVAVRLGNSRKFLLLSFYLSLQDIEVAWIYNNSKPDDDTLNC